MKISAPEIILAAATVAATAFCGLAADTFRDSSGIMTPDADQMVDRSLEYYTTRRAQKTRAGNVDAPSSAPEQIAPYLAQSKQLAEDRYRRITSMESTLKKIQEQYYQSREPGAGGAKKLGALTLQEIMVITTALLTGKWDDYWMVIEEDYPILYLILVFLNPPFLLNGYVHLVTFIFAGMIFVVAKYEDSPRKKFLTLLSLYCWCRVISYAVIFFLIRRSAI